MQVSQWEQRNAAFVPPTRIAHNEHPRDLSPPQTPSSAPPLQQDFNAQRPGAQNRQSTGFFSAFSRSRSSGSGQILSNPATPNEPGQQPNTGNIQNNMHTNNVQDHPPARAQSAPAQGQIQGGITRNSPPQNSPPPRMGPSPSAATQSTASPNPDAGPSAPSQQQPFPRPDEPFALGPTGIPLHPELRSVLRLNSVHQQKIYYSGRLSKRVERGTDGSRPAKDDGWIDIWCQLGGVTLSIWNMRAIEEANARGEQVPPQYINVTDAFVQVLGSVTFPATATSPPKRYTNVLTLNTAGSNLLLFVCESPAALVSWAAALRLAAWEKSRLEEIYTAHLLRITLTESRVWKEPRTTLVKGQLEGWARVRVAGQTDWKRLWVVISAGSSGYPSGTQVGHQSTLSLTRTLSQGSPSTNTPKKGRLSGLFTRSSHQHTPSNVSNNGDYSPIAPSGDIPYMHFFTGAKPKERKIPVLTVSSVTQAFAVYPERPDLITRSTLVKIEGRLGREEGAGAIKGTEAWVLIMPEVESGQPAGPRKMLEWVVGLHDAFKLYGRPAQYSFNPHNLSSLMFAYPIEPNLEQLFLERETAESLDPRDDATSIVRTRLTGLLQERMRQPQPRPSPQPQPQPDIPQTLPNSGAGRQPATGGRGPALTPITERSTTGETRTHTAGDSISPPNWSGHGSGGTNSGVEPSSNPGGIILPQGSALVKSPIEEEDENRLSRLWGGNGVVANGQPEAGARPMSMALGATNIEGPAATGADPRPQDNQPTEPQYNSRSSPPSHVTNPSSTTASGFTSNSSNHTAGNTTATSYSSPDMRLGTGVPEPAAVDLRGIDVEHRAHPNGHSYGAHPGYSPHEGDKPTLAPILTTALSPPPRGTEHQAPAQPAMQPSGAQPAIQPAVTHPPGAQSFAHPGAQAPAPVPAVQPLRPALSQSPPRGSNSSAPTQQQLTPAPQDNRHSASSVEGFIPSEAARWILGHEAEGSSNLGLSNMQPQPTQRALPGQRKTFESSSEDEEEQEPLQKPWQQDPTPSPVRRQSTPMAFKDMGMGAKPQQHEESAASQLYASPKSLQSNPSPPPSHEPPVTSATRPISGFSASGSRNLGRKPTGARAQPVKTPRVSKTGQQLIANDDEQPDASVRALPAAPTPPVPQPTQSIPPPDDMADDIGAADMLAALSFADRDPNAHRADSPPQQSRAAAAEPSRTPSPNEPTGTTRPPRQQPTLAPPTQQQGPTYRSTFAPSKHAAERKAKAQAHQAATEGAMKRPGRANGKKPRGSMATSRTGAWESSEEEEDAQEQEDGSDDEPLRSGPPSIHAQTNVLAPQPQQQQRGGFLGTGHGSTTDLHAPTPPGGRPLPSPDSHPQYGRPLRGLPALPGPTNGTPDHFGQGRPSYGPGSGPPSRAASQAYDGYNDSTQQPTPPPHAQVNPQPYRGAYRQTIWSNALDPNNRSISPGQKDTFVQINPNETMTKAFTPQGLLQAGLQDKHDRSAKRQEELARESGGSLLNVPNKPPPPQTGLLGAVSAHERDRKRDGGFGAVLTEREREKRMAEDRQRKIDDMQRQQLENQQMYGGMNPMMLNPMMTGMGMNPMGMMGYNPMMGGFDPQQQYQMWAAQQAAAEAYQRAMMTFSQAGSVAPGQQEEGGVAPRVASPMPGQWGMMGGMNPMMGMGGMGMNPMMGMGPMNPMMTGMGGFGGSQFGGMGMPMGGMTPNMGMGMSLNAQSPPANRDSDDAPIGRTASPAAGNS
ncbi:hypothetical protein B0J17DRAFT_765613 [Rhizoctonia solani]|nr:hypothetical protein B0J17DRAFT_765613 [Rhizoctonia solani]